MRKNLLSVVVPVYNEADLLSETIDEILRQLDSVKMDREIIVVDDGSLDRTWDLISSIAEERPHVRGLRLSRNFGKEAAVASGLQFASGDAVIVMDGDLQHPPELIPEMVRAWMENRADIVEAKKVDRGDEGLFSKIRAKLFYWLMGHLTGLSLDNSSDFKLLDRKVVDAHNSLPESSRFFRGIVGWLGFRKISLPFTVQDRPRGTTKWSLPTLLRLAVHASTSFSSLPLQLVTILGMLTLVVSFILGIQTLYMKFSGAAVSGFTTVILLLLLIASVLMLSLGIIGIYIGKIYEEVKNRPTFVIQDMSRPDEEKSPVSSSREET